MPYDLTKPLVIGISSRALFDLEKENQIFEEKGVRAYEDYQVAHEKDILKKGAAFELISAFLKLNELGKGRLVEVIIMSRNNPNTSVRIFNSIQNYGLDITRSAFTSGTEITPYLNAFKTDLFLSAYEEDVKQAINDGFAAGKIITGSCNASPKKKVDQIRIAFDGDAVLFSAASEKIYQQEGIDAFSAYEKQYADTPMEMGPFANFIKTVSNLQNMFGEEEEKPIRTALVTSRNAPAYERAIKTLRNWNVRIDEAFFLGGVRKTEILGAFGAHIFFDDQSTHTIPASEVVTSAEVPYRDGDNPKETE